MRHTNKMQKQAAGRGPGHRRPWPATTHTNPASARRPLDRGLIEVKEDMIRPCPALIRRDQPRSGW